MFVYLLQLREAATGNLRALILFPIMATTVWTLWAVKTALSRRYHPWTIPYETTTTVIIPVLDEPLELFTDVLSRITHQHPTEVIVVINGPRNPTLETACAYAGVRHEWTPTPGKRNAVQLGVGLATGDIVLLVDSDTLWQPRVLHELVKPFADPAIGGVTTKQRILHPRRHFFTRWADWLENSRALYSMPAQSTLGHVGCLPGRTIAFRRHILTSVMPDFMTAQFLGIFLEVSDDRTLTNLTLKSGYKCVYQSTALVYTDAPTQLPKLYKQQLRWARGSQYNTLRMLPWMLGHTPILAAFYIADVILPFLLLGTLISWAWHTHTHTGVNFLSPLLQQFPGTSGWVVAGTAIVAGSVLSMWLRQARHLDDVPADYLWMPLYILFSSFFLMPVRLIGFCRMAHTAGWGTRTNSYEGEQRHHWNPLALIPYLLAAVLIGGMVGLVVTVS